MTRECHVRFCERLREKLLRPTHHFGMNAHIGADADSGLVHSVVGTAANVNDVTQASALLHGEETDVFADAGYVGVDNPLGKTCRYLSGNAAIRMWSDCLASCPIDKALSQSFDGVQDLSYSYSLCFCVMPLIAINAIGIVNALVIKTLSISRK